MMIYFDMDGTIADLYGVDGWLEYLLAENPYPYMMAKPLVNMSVFARQLNRMTRQGFEIGIITWLSKNSTDDYDRLVADAKMRWLKRHLPSVHFTEIHIVKYGTPKYTLGDGILFDDEKPNRDAWGDGAYDVNEILKVLKKIELGA